METSETHILDQTDRILAEGIIVTDVTTLPLFGEMYTSPHYVISIHRQGSLDADYDSHRKTVNEHSLTIIYPNHTVLGHSTSSDFLVTLIIVSSKMFSSMSNHITLRDRFANEQRPNIPLTDNQYTDIMNIVDAMRSISRTNTPHRLEMQRNLLYTLVEMANTFRMDNNGIQRSDATRSLSKRFYEAMAKHCPPHRDVAFYADAFCLSPKYFSHRILEETGHSAGHWLHKHVIAQAKMLMRHQADASLQQIAHQLGFPEQSSFSRFFKRETGIAPDTWRRQQ